jgi:hypothetical protein
MTAFALFITSCGVGGLPIPFLKSAIERARVSSSDRSVVEELGTSDWVAVITEIEEEGGGGRRGGGGEEEEESLAASFSVILDGSFSLIKTCVDDIRRFDCPSPNSFTFPPSLS